MRKRVLRVRARDFALCGGTTSWGKLVSTGVRLAEPSHWVKAAALLKIKMSPSRGTPGGKTYRTPRTSVSWYISGELLAWGPNPCNGGGGTGENGRGDTVSDGNWQNQYRSTVVMRRSGSRICPRSFSDRHLLCYIQKSSIFHPQHGLHTALISNKNLSPMLLRIS